MTIGDFFRLKEKTEDNIEIMTEVIAKQNLKLTEMQEAINYLLDKLEDHVRTHDKAEV
jgi:uncharacterized coiled-coil protein SlyX